MRREDAIQNIRSRAAEYLQRDKAGTGFVCPACGSGSGKHGTGISSKDGIHFTCWAGCYTNADIIDILGIANKIDGFNDRLEYAARIFGITIDGKTTAAEDFAPARPPEHIHTQTYTQRQTAPEVVEDFTPYIEAAHQELMTTPAAYNYMRSRGLSEDIIKRYKLGYYSSGYNAFLKDFPQYHSKSRKINLYRYILPYPAADGRFHYFLSEIEDRRQIDGYNGKYRKMSGKSAEIFNERYLQNPPPVIFLCEGVYDALSVEDVGGAAIAFVGTAHRHFLELCEQYKPDTLFIVALDNDEAGQTNAQKVKDGLAALGIPYCVRSAAEGYKDFNEAMQADKAAFTEYIQQTIENAQSERVSEAEQEKADYLRNNTAAYLAEFMDGIKASADTPAIPTGFKQLDKALDDGLYEGLYIVGAISSLGKTTLVMQIADQIAQGGHDVLIFSLEMSRREIMAKSISRLTLQVAQASGSATAAKSAKTSRGITNGARYSKYSQEERELIKKAIKEYGTYADRIYISEGIGDIGVTEVRTTIEQHVRFTGRTPVVIIDYVQILAPYSERATDKQNTDKAVLELKRMSRDFKTPVIGISSFNRANYREKVSMEAFKESGAIEYSSDVLIGLQLKGAGDKGFDVDQKKAAHPREVELVILKNRNGKTGTKVNYNYYALFNYFEEEKTRDGA